MRSCCSLLTQTIRSDTSDWQATAMDIHNAFSHIRTKIRYQFVLIIQSGLKPT